MNWKGKNMKKILSIAPLRNGDVFHMFCIHISRKYPRKDYIIFLEHDIFL